MGKNCGVFKMARKPRLSRKTISGQTNHGARKMARHTVIKKTKKNIYKSEKTEEKKK